MADKKEEIMDTNVTENSDVEFAKCEVARWFKLEKLLYDFLSVHIAHAVDTKGGLVLTEEGWESLAILLKITGVELDCIALQMARKRLAERE